MILWFYLCLEITVVITQHTQSVFFYGNKSSFLFCTFIVLLANCSSNVGLGWCHLWIYDEVVGFFFCWGWVLCAASSHLPRGQHIPNFQSKPVLDFNSVLIETSKPNHTFAFLTTGYWMLGEQWAGSQVNNILVTGRGGGSAGDAERFVTSGSCYFSHYLKLSMPIQWEMISWINLNQGAQPCIEVEDGSLCVWIWAAEADWSVAHAPPQLVGLAVPGTWHSLDNGGKSGIVLSLVVFSSVLAAFSPPDWLLGSCYCSENHWNSAYDMSCGFLGHVSVGTSFKQRLTLLVTTSILIS